LAAICAVFGLELEAFAAGAFLVVALDRRNRETLLQPAGLAPHAPQKLPQKRS
jgi:hypothetical protein